MGLSLFSISFLSSFQLLVLRLSPPRLFIGHKIRKEGRGWPRERMSTCVPTPVSTAFSTVTENTIITTYSLSTSTGPPVITTRVDPYCQNEAVVLDSAVCLKTGMRTRTETLERTFPSLVVSIPGFRSIDVIPVSRNLNSLVTAAFNDRHGLPHSGMIPAPIPIQHSITSHPHLMLTVALPRVSKYSRLGCCLHDFIRNHDPGRHPGSHQHILQWLL